MLISRSLLACPEGIEPPTHSLEGCCSIRLSYGHKEQRLQSEITLEPYSKKWSEYKDSNLGPPGPKPGALPDCATLRQAVF